MGAPKVLWTPQPGPQTALVTCPIEEVCYGGARGGGKTDGMLGDWASHSDTWGEAATGIFFRRKQTQLEEVIARSMTIFGQMYSPRCFNTQRSFWKFPNGARLKFRYLEKDRDAEEYQGHSYTRVYIEEATNFPTPSPINLLRGTLRSASGAHLGLRLTCNPGGPGHKWVKERYIKPHPAGYKVLKEYVEALDGTMITQERVFIPAKLQDNQLLLLNDPKYVGRLRQVGSSQLVNAWLKGDWDIVEGAFFDRFSVDTHVLPAEEWLPRIMEQRDATRFVSFDWGSSKPFSVGWYIISNGAWGLPRDVVVKYREWYGSSGPNTGLRLSPRQVAIGILEREHGERIRYRVADPSIFIRDGGPSIGESMFSEGVAFRKADNKRKTGWIQLRQALGGDFPEGRVEPKLLLLSTCPETIQELQTIPADERDPEDVDTDAEDHAVDDTRYAMMSRPRLTPENPSVIRVLKNPNEMTIDELIARRRTLRASNED
jgi:hypothetical protein